MKAVEIIQNAGREVEDFKAKEHGEKKENFKAISDLWESYHNVAFTKKDVAMLMALMKIGRIKTKSAPHNDDNFIDAIGYLAIAGEFSAEKYTVIRESPDNTPENDDDR
jgi:hypothetical protein